MNAPRLHIRRILTSVGILALLLYFLLTWLNMLGDLYERTGSDFMGFYTFGRITQDQGYPAIYKIEEQQKLQEQIVGHPVRPIFYTHLPFIAPLAVVLVDEDYVASFQRWAVVLLLLNGVNVYLLIRTLDISMLTRENLAVLGLGTFLFDPTFSGFMNGQDTALLLLGAVLWIYGLFSKQYLLSGICLSLTTVRPQIALFLAIPFLFHHRRVFWGFVIGSSVLALISLGLLRVEGMIRFVESIRFIEGTVWQEAHALDMPTLSGIIRRNLELSNFEPIQSLVWLFYVLGILGFAILWWRSPEINEKNIGLICLASILLVPYAHYHDLILLLVPIFCLLRIIQAQKLLHQNYLAVLPLGISWILTIGFAGSGMMKFPIVYSLMFMLAYLLIIAERERQPLLPSSA